MERPLLYIVVDDVLGLNNLLGEIKIYPNPGQSFVFIESASILEVVIQDLDGKILKRSVTNREINIDELSTGIYIIQFNDESGQISSKRFLKE